MREESEAATTTSAFLDALRERVLVYDGAMGTSLQALELTATDFGGAGREGWIDGLVLSRPNVIANVHRTFLAAGCDVIETCTFQATRPRLAEWGAGGQTYQLNHAAATLARNVCDEFSTARQPRFVAGSIGPSGFLPSSSDPSLGMISFAKLVDTFAEQAEGLVDGGCDLIVIETAQDLLEVKAAIFGVRRAFTSRNTSLPLHVSVSLDTNSRMLLGTDIGAVFCVLDALDVDIIGINCSIGPDHMGAPLRYLAEHTTRPVACIPNAGIPTNVGGKAHFPLQAVPMAEQLAHFVNEIGVDIVGGCCGSTPRHIAELASRVSGSPRRQRTVYEPPMLASSMGATPLLQEPRPLLIGERVNAQGSKKIKRLLLDDDYDGILSVARAQVNGGAHALDVSVALTERSDETEQMRRVVTALQMAVDAPLCIDSTDQDVIRTALENCPGRPVVNSVNLEGGRARCEAVLPLVRDHGACVIALTIDEQGMATTRLRKLDIARRIRDIACQEFSLRPEQLLFDALTFTLATGESEWVESAVETIEGIRLIKQELPGVLTVLGISNVSFGLGGGTRAVLNSVFLHHCIEAGLDAAIINPALTVPYAEIGASERRLAEDLIFNRDPAALANYVDHFSANTMSLESTAPDPFAGMTPDERIAAQILHRHKDGIEEQLELALQERTAIELINEVLLPVMKDVGDRFGAGELILPFVLQSAEVMKRAMAHLEQYLERHENHSKGKIVLATVYGDVHDIGKNLVSTILTNNGYTVYDLGKQVPINTIIDKAVEVEADAIGLSALLVSTSRQMPQCLQELAERNLEFPVIIGGAAINRSFGRRILYLDGSGHTYAPGVFYCKDAFEALDTADQLTDSSRHEALVSRIHDEAALFRDREQARLEERAKHTVSTTSPPNRSATRTDVPVPTPPFWGARTLAAIDPDAVYPCIDRNSLFKMSWQFRGVTDPKQWAELVRDELEPRLARSMRDAKEEGWLDLQAVYGYWPALGDGDAVIVFDPQDVDREIGRFTFPRQHEQNRLCLADYVRPRHLVVAGERDVIALQLVTTGPGPSQTAGSLQASGNYDDMLQIHGFATQMAEATAEWLHRRIRLELGLGPDQGRRYSWGYPACPELSEHATFFKIVPTNDINVSLTAGFQLDPEQSTAAIVMHHPEARYFGIYKSHTSIPATTSEPERGTS